jgi:alkylation response protein AidB-like acyl-CoA dehydrogenase
MTEPAVASSDATNIQTSIVRDGDDYVINGRKWWSTNMGHPNVRIAIVMGKTDTSAAVHQQQSQILVPTDTPGFRVERMLTVFGYDERPIGHAEVVLDNVRVPATNLIAGEGRGFEIAQGRLGPGRIHHCMRVIGAAEKALELMCERLLNRTAFRKQLAEHSVWEQRVGEARTNIEMCRLMVLKAAWMMDKAGPRTPSPRSPRSRSRRRAWRCRSSTTPSRRSAAPGSRAIRPWPRCTPGSAPCVWPTVRTRSTTAPSPGWNTPNTAGADRFALPPGGP